MFKHEIIGNVTLIIVRYSIDVIMNTLYIQNIWQ